MMQNMTAFQQQMQQQMQAQQQQMQKQQSMQQQNMFFAAMIEILNKQ